MNNRIASPARMLPGFLLLAAALLLPGCGDPGHEDFKDVTAPTPANHEFLGGYQPEHPYVLTREVFLVAPEASSPEPAPAAPQPNADKKKMRTPEPREIGQNYLGVPESGLAPHGRGHLPSLDAYRQDPGSWPYIVGVVDAGTQVRVKRFILVTRMEDERLDIHAALSTHGSPGADVIIDQLSIPANPSGTSLAMSPNPAFLAEPKPTKRGIAYANPPLPIILTLAPSPTRRPTFPERAGQ